MKNTKNKFVNSGKRWTLGDLIYLLTSFKEDKPMVDIGYNLGRSASSCLDKLRDVRIISFHRGTYTYFWKIDDKLMEVTRDMVVRFDKELVKKIDQENSVTASQ